MLTGLPVDETRNLPIDANIRQLLVTTHHNDLSHLVHTLCVQTYSRVYIKFVTIGRIWSSPRDGSWYPPKWVDCSELCGEVTDLVENTYTTWFIQLRMLYIPIQHTYTRWIRCLENSSTLTCSVHWMAGCHCIVLYWLRQYFWWYYNDLASHCYTFQKFWWVFQLPEKFIKVMNLLLDLLKGNDHRSDLRFCQLSQNQWTIEYFYIYSIT